MAATGKVESYQTMNDESHNPRRTIRAIQVVAACLLLTSPLPGCSKTNGAAKKTPTRAPKTFRQELARTAKDSSDTKMAVHSLASVPDASSPPTIASGERSEQEFAANAIVGIGKSAVPELLQTLRSENPFARRQAALVLARIGPDAKDAVEDLIVALDDPDASVRKAAARALGNIGPAAERAIPFLVRVMTGERQLAQESQPPPESRAPILSRTPAVKAEYDRPYRDETKSRPKIETKSRPPNDSVYGSDTEGVEIESARADAGDAAEQTEEPSTGMDEQADVDPREPSNESVADPPPAFSRPTRLKGRP